MAVQLLYIADPMCSWCYGFGPQLTQLLAAMPDAKLDILCGGLRPDETEAVSDEMRKMILGHWDRVAEVSGLPFDREAMSRPGWVYCTEPASRAMVSVKLLAEHLPGEKRLHVFHALQSAFYRDGLDVTNDQVLAEVLTAALNAVDGADSYDAASLLETLQSADAHQCTREEFALCQQWGVRSFPALLMVHDNNLHMLSSGYATTEQLQSQIARVLQAG